MMDVVAIDGKGRKEKKNTVMNLQIVADVG
jgi:hypothetical protein